VGTTKFPSSRGSGIPWHARYGIRLRVGLAALDKKRKGGHLLEVGGGGGVVRPCPRHYGGKHLEKCGVDKKKSRKQHLWAEGGKISLEKRGFPDGAKADRPKKPYRPRGGREEGDENITP